MIFGKHLIFGSLIAPSLCAGSFTLEKPSDTGRIGVDSPSGTDTKSPAVFRSGPIAPTYADTKSSAVLRAGRFEIVTRKKLEPIFRAVRNGDVNALRRLVPVGRGSRPLVIAVELNSKEAGLFEQNYLSDKFTTWYFVEKSILRSAPKFSF